MLCYHQNMTLILLVRHGQNEWVTKNRLACWTPEVHLNEQGKKEVAQLGGRLAHLPINAIYSSPLERCMETADAIASSLGLEISALEDIGEVRYGKWEGKKIKKLAKKRSWFAVQHYPSRFQFPDGETLRHVQQRAVDAIEALAKQHLEEMIVVVSHADVIKLTLAHFLGMHIDLFQRIGLSPASVSILALSRNGPVRVLRMNDSGPIRAPKKRGKEKHQESTHDNQYADSPDHGDENTNQEHRHSLDSHSSEERT